jgi:hypothetical protein
MPTLVLACSVAPAGDDAAEGIDREIVAGVDIRRSRR